jgi:hypothetical protein
MRNGAEDERERECAARDHCGEVIRVVHGGNYVMRAFSVPVAGPHRPPRSGLTPFGATHRSSHRAAASFGPTEDALNDGRGSPWLKYADRARRGGALVPALAAFASLWPLPGAAHTSAPSLIDVEIYDRTSGATLDLHGHDGQRFVIGAPGHEYAIRIRNRSGARILAVTSVDGVNVINGQTASTDQSGYTVDAGGSVEIAGWRRSFNRTAAFYFTDLGQSYAARTGRPADVGVIGVAVFRERLAAGITSRAASARITLPSPEARPAEGAEVPLAARSNRPDTRDARSADIGANAAPAAQLGTGFGRTETSFAYRTHFDRESDIPAETFVVRYDRRENLAAMGVLPQPHYADRTPDPFPGMRFVPDPPR